ncbi:MAG: hypothetical protein ACRD7E_14025 [Bryobacteraceae bacterium]
MPNNITNRIVAETGIPRLFEVLTEELSASDLQSLLLAVYKSRVRPMREPGVLARADGSTLVVPSSVDARLLNVVDREAYAAATGFEAVELSPVCPLGTQQVLGAVDQNNVLTTTRNAEVLGDSTPALALECARRRKVRVQDAPEQAVRLCSSHRVVRMQPFHVAGFTPHFRLFGLVSAGRDTGSSAFEIRHFAEHIQVYLQLFRALNAAGFQLTNPLVELSDLGMAEVLLAAKGASRDEVREIVRAHIPGSSDRFLGERNITLPKDILDPAVELKDLVQGHGLDVQLDRLRLLKEYVVDPLREQYPEACFRFNLARLEGLGYYTGLCLRISPTAPDGNRYPVTDGGFTDWTARLLQNKKERLLTSGCGSEFICRRYRAVS